MLYKFYRVKNNLLKAVSKDRQAKIMINYKKDINQTHLLFQISGQKHKIHFESHRNGSCTIFLPRDLDISSDNIQNMKNALKTLKFTGEIEFDWA